MDVHVPAMAALHTANADQQLEPVDLRCREDTLGAHRMGTNEPLDLSTTPRTEHTTMEPYYYNHQYTNQFTPNHSEPSIYRHNERYACYNSRSHNVPSDYRRALPYYWNTCMYSLGNNHARNHVPAHSSHNPQWKSNVNKSTCEYDEAEGMNSYMSRPSCVFSERRGVSDNGNWRERRGVSDYGNWREMYSYTETVQEVACNASMAQDHDRNMVLTNGGSCKYTQNYSTSQADPMGSPRDTVQQEYLRIPQYSCRSSYKKSPQSSRDTELSTPCHINHGEVFVSNNKLFTGGCILSTKKNVEEDPIHPNLPPISVTDFVFKSESNEPEAEDSPRGFDVVDEESSSYPEEKQFTPSEHLTSSEQFTPSERLTPSEHLIKQECD